MGERNVLIFGKHVNKILISERGEKNIKIIARRVSCLKVTLSSSKFQKRAEFPVEGATNTMLSLKQHTHALILNECWAQFCLCAQK